MSFWNWVIVGALVGLFIGDLWSGIIIGIFFGLIFGKSGDDNQQQS